MKVRGSYSDGRPAMGCRVCGRLLARVTQRHANTYVHSGPADHPPQPVPADNLEAVRFRCDICSGPDPVWAYRSVNQRSRRTIPTRQSVNVGDYRRANYAAPVRTTSTAPAAHVENWGEEWLACEVDAALIEEANLLRLVERGVEGLPAKLRRGKRLIEGRAILTQVYTVILETRAPGRRRLDTPEPSDGQAPP